MALKPDSAGTGPNYQKTLIACYMGFITQAIVANFTPLLFLKFHRDFGIPLGRVAAFSTVFYFTQLLVDLFCAKFVDRIGYRKCVVASEALAAAGLVGLAVLPFLLPDPFTALLISVILYAGGAGLIEVLVSPIVEACPFDNKASVMSLLHSFYCWGSVAVILVSTALFAVFGLNSWPFVACLWAIVPFVNLFNFLSCPIRRLTEENEGMKIRQLFRLPVFWVMIVLMICAGASELCMAQWASAYTESALGITKSLGDILGPCLFAVAQGVNRTFYGKFGARMNLLKFMFASGVLCLACYLLVALSPAPAPGLTGCILCGFSVGIMWPGTISIASKRIPLGGTAMFALLAMAGDLGGSIGPGLVGVISQNAGNNLRAGMLAGCLFPAVLILSSLLLAKAGGKRRRS